MFWKLMQISFNKVNKIKYVCPSLLDQQLVAGIGLKSLENLRETDQKREEKPPA
jgi:hypothetical protein